MSTNSFSPRKFVDFTIVKGKNRVGHIRIKPSGVLWAPANSKVWYGINLSKFAEFAEKNGKRQKK